MIDYVFDCIQDPEDTLEVWDTVSHISGDTQDAVVFCIKNGPDSCSVTLKKSDVLLLAKSLVTKIKE